jgi:hypothetical protein
MSDFIRVDMTNYEVKIAASIGAARRVMKLFSPSRRDYNGAEVEDGWRIDIEGACGEMVLAKWARAYWSGNLGRLDLADVGPLQVRTRTRHDYELPLYDKDHPDHLFVLVTGVAPQFALRGWIRARDGKRNEWVRSPKPSRCAYFVPTERLEPMATLMSQPEAAEYWRFHANAAAA